MYQHNPPSFEAENKLRVFSSKLPPPDETGRLLGKCLYFVPKLIYI